MANNFNWGDGYPEINEAIGDERFERAIRELKQGIRKAPKLTREEYEVLAFCHGRDMRQFLKEEFEKHPIILDEDGCLVGENPFDKERRESGEPMPPHTYEDYIHCSSDFVW